MTRIGWYVHHHGFGHLARFLAVRPHLAGEVEVFSSMSEPDGLPDDTTWTQLPRDDHPIETPSGPVPAAAADPTVHGLLHWAPQHHTGHTARLVDIADAVRGRRFDAFVVDVSVEVTLFVRLLGVPVVVMTQPGERDDRPHRLAFDAADRIIAPWPERLYTTPFLERVRERVTWTGGISRFAERSTTAPVARRPGSVLVLGKVGPDGADRSGSPSHWSSAGWSSAGTDASDWVADPFAAIRSADVVISAAGQNSVADLAVTGAHAVVLPQERPFAEQVATGRALADAGLAIVLDHWPDEQAWTDHLSEARALRPDWALWETDGAAQRAAAVILRTAEAGVPVA